MLKIDLSAIDVWTWQKKAWLLGCICCLTITLSYLSLIASPLRQLQQQQSIYAENHQHLIAQRLLLQRDKEQLTVKKLNRADQVMPQNSLPPLKALKQCALDDFTWQHQIPTVGQGRPLYSLTMGLQYEQAICLLNTLSKYGGEGYLQKMVLSYQDDQPALSMQLHMTNRNSE